MKRRFYFLAGLLLFSIAASAQRYVGGARTIEGGVNSVGTTTGSANAYVATMATGKPLASYQLDACYTGKANFANTGTATLAIDGLAALTIKKLNGTTNLASGDIASGQVFTVCYDGTNLQMQSQVGNAASGSGTVNSGTATHLGYYAGTGTAISDMGALFTFSGSTLTGSSSAIFDMSAAPVTTGLKIPSAAGAAPTVDGQIAVNTTNHHVVVGSNGTTVDLQAAASTLHSISFSIDNGASVVPTGELLGYNPTAHFTCASIVSMELSAYPSGSATVDVWKHAAGTIPTVADKISASAPLTLSSSRLNQGQSASTWTAGGAVALDDVFGFNVLTATTVTKLLGQIWCQ